MADLKEGTNVATWTKSNCKGLPAWVVVVPFIPE